MAKTEKDVNSGAGAVAAKMTPFKALQASATRQRGLYSTPGQSLVEARWLPLASVVENPEQVRQEFNEAQLQELADDIAERGVLEPILVRALDERGDKFQIVAGARRYRASLLAGKEEIPVIIKEVTPKEARAMMLVENLQRQDLTDSEERRYFQMLQAEENLGINDIARLINRSEWYVRSRLQKPAQAEDKKSKTVSNADPQLLSKKVATEPTQAVILRKEAFKERPLFAFNRYLESVEGYLETQPPAEERRQLKEKLEEVEKQIQKLKAALQE